MLFVLTGGIQTGKTRWLDALVTSLEERQVTCAGVLAPGVWKDWRGCEEVFAGAEVDANGFEKLGIDNVLLPQKTALPFATRVDLAAADAESQSAKAGLRWSIDEAAIGQVNAHFRSLRACGVQGRALFVIDELGILELERGGGLTEAVGLLEDGPRGECQHVLVVVREALAGKVAGRFAKWGEQVFIRPDDAGEACVLRAFGA